VNRHMLLVLLGALLSGKPISAQAPVNLTNLRELTLSVGANEYATSIGLTQETVGNEIFVGIKRDLPRLKLVETAGSSNFLLVVNCIEVTTGHAACDVRVELRRPADVVAEDGKSIIMRGMASVWGKDHLFSGGSAQISARIHEYLSQMMTEFAGEYYRQNPN